MTVHIGVHPHNPSLYHLSRLGFLETLLAPLGETAEWHQIGGLDTAAALADRRIDFGGTGSTPPLSAQADGHDLVYAAVSAPRPGHGALLVRDNVESVAALAGQTVDLAIGSWQTHFVSKLLSTHGLDYGRDITARRATSSSADDLRNGRIAAWVAQGAELFAARRAGARTLVEAGDVIADRSVFFTRRDFADARPEIVGTIGQALQQADEWAAANLTEAAAFAAADQGGQPEDWHAAYNVLPWRLEPVSDAFLAEQQEAADILAAAGFLVQPVKIAEIRHAGLDQAVAAALGEKG